MYTLKEAQKIARYYKDKVIGKPLSEEKAKDLPIKHLEIEELEDHSYNIFCYGDATISVSFFTTIDKVANDLKPLTPKEVLKLEE